MSAVLLACGVASAAPAPAPDERSVPSPPGPPPAPPEQTPSPVASSPPEAASPSEHPVRFRADRVELEPRGDQLVLEGDVVVTASRYRLSGDRLELRRTGRGIVVDGAGRVAFCPCADPPVSFGFQSALVAPPTDLLLEQPTLRVGPVPVLWLPYLWLRSRARVGALPPSIAWRGDDGLMAGTGVHLPFDRAGETFLDLRGGGYLQGGADLEARLDSSATSSVVRWDHLDDDLVVLDLRGAVEQPATAVIAWNVDAMRGARAASGPLLLEESARRSDRARVSAGKSSGAWTAGGSIQSDLVRGGDLDTLGAIGPGVFAAVSAPVGEVGSAEGAVGLTTTDAGDGTVTTRALGESAVRLDARPSVFGFEAQLRSGATTSIESASAPSGGVAGLQVASTLPLVRRFAGSMAHFVTPRVDGGIALASRDRALTQPWLFDDPVTVNATLGFDTTLGSYVGRQGSRMEARAGWIGEPDDATPAARVRAIAWTDLVGLSLDGGWLENGASTTALMARARLGAVDSLNVRGYASGESGAATRLHFLEEGGWEAASAPFYDRAGWTAGGGVQVPWTPWLASAADVDYDVTPRTLLGVRGATGYRHSCGCIAVLGTGGHRVGRPGFDASVTVDLVP